MSIQLTAAQASAVTGPPLKAINKAIDLRTVPSTARAKRGVWKRYVSESALVCLKLEAEGLTELPLRFSKAIFKLVLTHQEMLQCAPSKQFKSKWGKPGSKSMKASTSVAVARRFICIRMWAHHDRNRSSPTNVQLCSVSGGAAEHPAAVLDSRTAPAGDYNRKSKLPSESFASGSVVVCGKLRHSLIPHRAHVISLRLLHW